MSVDISQLTASLPAEQRGIVLAEYRRQAKDSTTAFLLCFFLGIFGAHCFYLGRPGQGIFRLVISPLIIPGLIWEIIDLLRIDRVVHVRNLTLAEQLVAGAMLAVPNSAALEAALGQMDATLRRQPAPALEQTQVSAPALQLTSLPSATSHDLHSGTESAVSAAEARLAVADLAPVVSVELPQQSAPSAEDGASLTVRDLPPSDADGNTGHAEPVVSAPTYEWAPQWPVDAEVALAAERAVAANAAPDPTPDPAPEPPRPTAVLPDPDATLPRWNSMSDVPVEPEPAFSIPEEQAVEPQVEHALETGPVVGAWGTTVSADDGVGEIDPGTAALAFGWLESAATPSDRGDSRSFPAGTGTEPSSVEDAEALFAPPAAGAMPGRDMTDRSMPTVDAGSTADVGEIGSASRVTVPLIEYDAGTPSPGGDESAWADATEATSGFENSPEPPDIDATSELETQNPVLVLVADDESDLDPDLTFEGTSLALAAVQTTAGEEATGADVAETSNVADVPQAISAEDVALDAVSAPTPAADDQAQVTEEPHVEQAISGAEPARMVKRVRVVRRLLVNGQVVRETSAEQVIDGDADSQEAAASLQRTLGTTDPDTLRALAADMDFTLPTNAQTPIPPPPSQAATDSNQEGKQPTND